MFYHNYQFKCRDCETIFEVTCPMENVLGLEVNCPACYSENTYRKFSVPSIHFQGRGFYSTDNKKKKENK